MKTSKTWNKNHRTFLLPFAGIIVLSFCANVGAVPSAEVVPKAQEENSKFLVITEDIIPDIENTTQKVIRVNPLDLPALKDNSKDSMESSLFKIKSLLPFNRNYVNSNSMRRQKPADSPILRSNSLPEAKLIKPKHSQKKKKLNFLYDQPDFDGHALTKSMKVHVAPGAYPIYYTVAKTNGKFGKFPLKSFSSVGEFRKYLIKSKQEPIPFMDRYES